MLVLFTLLALDFAGYAYHHLIPGLAAAVIALVLAIFAIIFALRGAPVP